MGLFGSLVSKFLSSLYMLDISLLSDVGLVKIVSQSVGCCFVLLTVSFSLWRLCNFMRSHLLIFFFILEHKPLVSVQELSPCANVFEAIPHFLFYYIQHIWFYVEVFDPLGLELCTRRQVWIDLYHSWAYTQKILQCITRTYAPICS